MSGSPRRGPALSPALTSNFPAKYGGTLKNLTWHSKGFQSPPAEFRILWTHRLKRALSSAAAGNARIVPVLSPTPKVSCDWPVGRIVVPKRGSGMSGSALVLTWPCNGHNRALGSPSPTSRSQERFRLYGRVVAGRGRNSAFSGYTAALGGAYNESSE
jgi:hypothetical protein